jgi:hypothetical protein
MPRTKTVKPSIKNATKPVVKGKEPKTSKRDVVTVDRERFVKMLREAGLQAEERSAWLKVTGKEGRRVYVQRKGPQVHMTFPLRVAGVQAISEAEAAKRHLGSVRSVVHLDRQGTESLTAIFRAAIAGLR